MDTEQIKSLIEKNLQVHLIEVDDDSYRHRNHKQAVGKGGHYNLLVVSDDFIGMDMISRHRKIYDILQMHTHQHIHALSIKAHTKKEWEQKGSK